MTIILIVILALVAAILACAWSRRGRVLQRYLPQQHPTTEELPPGESQTIPVKNVGMPTSDSAKAERNPTHVVIALSNDPAHLEQDITNLDCVQRQAVDEHISDERPKTLEDQAPPVGEIQSPAVPHQLVSTSDRHTIELDSIPRLDPPAAETKSSGLLSETNLQGNTFPTAPAIEDQNLINLDTPAVKSIAAVSTPSTNVVASDANERIESSPTETEPAFSPPTYQPPTPPPSKAKPAEIRERRPRSISRTSVDLRLRLQLVFGRGGTVKTLALVPDRRDGMPDDIEIAGTQGTLPLTELRDDCYEPVPLPDAANALIQGIEWRGRGNASRWRWILGGRPLYVFAPGDEFGLHGFVSTARLWLNARHAVLAAASLRQEVLAALANVGCSNPVVNDDQIPGVPTGWLLFLEVTPTNAAPMRDEKDILNVLCPGFFL